MFVAVDIETHDPTLKEWGPGTFRGDGFIIGVGLYSPGEYEGFYRPTDPLVKEVLENPTITKIFHNGVYDTDWLVNWAGINIQGRVEDTMTRETLLDAYATSYSLDNCCIRRGVTGKNKEDTIDAWWASQGNKSKAIEHLKDIPFGIVGKYCVQDCKATFNLFLKQQPLLEAQGLVECNRIECDLYPILWIMRKNGSRLDLPRTTAYLDELCQKEEDAIAEFSSKYGIPKFSINSASDLEQVWKAEHLPIEYTATGKPSFTAAILDDCSHPIAHHVKEVRSWGKTISFINSWLMMERDGILRSVLYPAKRDAGGTVTGRWSSQYPNCVTMDVVALTGEGYKHFDEHTKQLQTSTGIKEVIGTMTASKRPVVRIETIDGHSIGATEDSKVACWTAEGIQWKEYKTLSTEDYVLIKIGSEVPGKQCSLDLAYVLGSLNAEGWHLNFWNSDFDYALEYKRHAENLWGKNIPMYESVRGPYDCHGWEVYVPVTKEREKLCNQWGFNYGAKSYEKRVPAVIMQADKQAIITYLKAYIQGDGCIHNRQVAIYTSSKGMVQDLQLLFLRIGIYSFIEGPYTNENAFTEGHPQYHLKISGLSLNVMRDIFGTTLKGKEIPYFTKGCAKDNVVPFVKDYFNNKYGKYSKYLRDLNNGCPGNMSRLRARYFIDDPIIHDYLKYDLQAVKIASVSHTVEDVYDYTVPTTEGVLGQPHFIANGFVQYDCQQVPAREDKGGKEIRSLFIPFDGYILGAFDYKQIEYRVFLHFAQGKDGLIAQEKFRKDPNTDYHQMTIDLMDWNDLGKEGRHLAKNLNFGSIYGLGARSFAVKFKQNLLHNHPERDPDNLLPVAQELMNEYFRKVPFVKPTCEAIMRVGEKRGYVKTLSGRRQRMPLDRGSYKLINYLVQGSAADILKKGLVDAYNNGVFDILKPHVPVHDELVFSAPESRIGVEACMELARCMREAYELKIPIGVDTEVGPDWGHCDIDNWNSYCGRYGI